MPQKLYEKHAPENGNIREQWTKINTHSSVIWSKSKWNKNLIEMSIFHVNSIQNALLWRKQLIMYEDMSTLIRGANGSQWQQEAKR